MPGGTSLTALAFLTNPLQLRNSKTWHFDASIFLNDESGIMGRVRYFNTPNLNFPPTGVYIIHAWIVQMKDTYDLHLASQVEANAAIQDKIYDFVGDIQWMIPLHEETPAAQAGQPSTFRLPNIKTEYQAYITFSGIALNADKAAGKFDMDVSQYLQFIGGTAELPVSCLIQDSGRWTTSGKPVPHTNKFAAVSGYIVAIKDSEAGTVPGSPHTRRFQISVDNVVYGFSPQAATHLYR